MVQVDGIVEPVQDSAAPAGRVVAIRTAGSGAERAGPARLERGPLDVVLVVQGLPVDEFPAGTRLRLGARAVVELAAESPGARATSRAIAWEPGVVEVEGSGVVRGMVLEAGPVAAGDEVSIEAVSVPLTDVLDLHSFRPEETQQVVTAYLDEARRAGLGEVRIIHGRGRGVQRAAIRQMLAKTAGVADFSDAPPARGGWGATVVRLHPAEDVTTE
jgi:hypothetical protein